MRTEPKFGKVTIDYITHTADKGEFALYLVEDAPWSDVESRVKLMQERVYTAMDVVLDGQLASDYPDSKGKGIRIEVVCRGEDPPDRFREVVHRLNEIVHGVGDYRRDIEGSVFISSLDIIYSQRPSGATG